MNDNYQIISVNGSFINRDDFKIPLTNRAFRFGDGLFETMHANGLEVQFLTDHFDRIMYGAKTLKLELASEFTLEYLKNHVNGLLNRCKLYQGAKVRLMMVRQGAGLYIPESNGVDIIIEAEFLSKGPYELNKNGLVIDIYPEKQLGTNQISAFKNMNALPYILGGIYVKQNEIDDALFINADENIIEATSSNVFCFKERTLFTPGLNSGCVNGVMRKNIIRIAKLLGYEVNSSALFNSDMLLEMDEIFLTNTVSGIKWVTGFQQRRYYKRYSVKLLQELNRQLFD